MDDGPLATINIFVFRGSLNGWVGHGFDAVAVGTASMRCYHMAASTSPPWAQKQAGGGPWEGWRHDTHVATLQHTCSRGAPNDVQPLARRIV